MKDMNKSKRGLAWGLVPSDHIVATKKVIDKKEQSIFKKLAGSEDGVPANFANALILEVMLL